MASRPVLVIGAAGAIGAAVCADLAENGYVVHAADLVAPDGIGQVAHALDVTDDAAVSALVEELWEAGPPAGVVYTAGLVTTGPVADLDWGRYEALMEVNLRGAFRVGKAVAGQVRQGRHDLSLVFLASVAGLTGEAGGSIYCASKFGLVGFVQSLAAELAPSGVRANAVCPGNVDSPMLRELAEAVAAERGVPAATVLAELAGASAFDRLIEPAEVARVCTFLVSPLASGVSGQSLVVDGPPAI
ncbi:MAG: SDR family oxidoreductase [Nocardioidaceae bacterium]|nr:SDR family oxidoreductase [Nocardioidaceae bacterium]